jgi:integrase
VAELERARLAWGVWADGVRKRAEQRTGLSVADGFGLLDDGEYERALRLQTGLRVSELTGLTTGDVHLGPGAHVRCHGKGRKDRATPLTRQTTTVLRAWLAERGGGPGDPLFPTGQAAACPATPSSTS